MNLFFEICLEPVRQAARPQELSGAIRKNNQI